MPHNTMERVTIRVPNRILERAKVLADTGEYPNRSEVFREGARELFAKYDFEREVPTRSQSRAPPPEMIMANSRDSDGERAAALQRIYALRSIANGQRVVIFDAGGLLDASALPDDLVVARDSSELRAAIRGIDD